MGLVIDMNILENKDELYRHMMKHTTITLEGHWLWIGMTKDGYGRIDVKGKLYRVHRLSAYMYLSLDLDSEFQANHKVSCTHKNCWNPDHLYTGTQSDNETDIIVTYNEKESFPCGHLRDENNTRIVFNTRAAAPMKSCKICHNKSAHTRRDRLLKEQGRSR